MEVILLQDVPNVGKKYDVAKVSSGFAQNFLIPNKFAEHATKNKKSSAVELQKQVQADKKVQDDLLAKNVDELKDVTVTFSEKANEQGHLFKGIHIKEILKTLQEQKHITLPEDAIILEEPIKAVGEHSITVEVGGSKTSFKVVVVAVEEK